MTTETKTYRTAILTGDTYAIRNTLKLLDWEWDASRKAWTKETSLTADEVFARIRTALGGRSSGRLTCSFEE